MLRRNRVLCLVHRRSEWYQRIVLVSTWVEPTIDDYAPEHAPPGLFSPQVVIATANAAALAAAGAEGEQGEEEADGEEEELLPSPTAWSDVCTSRSCGGDGDGGVARETSPAGGGDGIEARGGGARGLEGSGRWRRARRRGVGGVGDQGGQGSVGIERAAGDCKARQWFLCHETTQLLGGEAIGIGAEARAEAREARLAHAPSALRAVVPAWDALQAALARRAEEVRRACGNPLLLI